MLRTSAVVNSGHFLLNFAIPVIAVVAGLNMVFVGSAGAADGPSGMAPQMNPDMQSSMMNDMKPMHMSSDADFDFATMMKQHHEGALHMAQVELNDGKDATLRKMAATIIDGQTKEIKELDDWLAKHKEPMHHPMTAPTSPGSPDSRTTVSPPR